MEGVHESENCYISPMNALYYMKGCIRRKVKCDLRKVIYDDKKDNERFSDPQCTIGWETSLVKS